MVLLIQYKTVQLYTPPEHKNFSIVAIIGSVRYPGECLHNDSNAAIISVISMYFPFFLMQGTKSRVSGFFPDQFFF